MYSIVLFHCCYIEHLISYIFISIFFQSFEENYFGLLMTYQNGQRKFMVELVYQNQSDGKFNLILIVSRKEGQIDEADVTFDKCFKK